MKKTIITGVITGLVVWGITHVLATPRRAQPPTQTRGYWT
jgi:hypothetical protein